MKQRKCKQGKLGFCYDYGNCDDCIFSQMTVKYENKIKKLKARNEILSAELSRCTEKAKAMGEEKKQAVKEFAEKLQKELPCRDYTFNGNTYSMILTSSTKYVIDKLLKEYEV